MIRVESTNQTKKRTPLVLSAAVGAAAGMGVRYLLPTKAELSTFKNQADTFFSSSSLNARGANRSMLKYGAIGALVLGGINLVSKMLSKKEENKEPISDDTFEYSRFQTLIEAPEYACELLLYTDN